MSKRTFGKDEEWRKGKEGIGMRRSHVRKGSLWFEKDNWTPVFPLLIVFDHPPDFRLLSSLSSVHRVSVTCFLILYWIWFLVFLPVRIEKRLWFSRLLWSNLLCTTHFVEKVSPSRIIGDAGDIYLSRRMGFGSIGSGFFPGYNMGVMELIGFPFKGLRESMLYIRWLLQSEWDFKVEVVFRTQVWACNWREVVYKHGLHWTTVCHH